MKTLKYIIYGLVDPRDDKIKYVGRSSSGLHRPQCHTSPSRIGLEKSKKAQWVKELLSLGMRYSIVVIEVCRNQTELSAAEIRWIRYYKKLCPDLTNGTLDNTWRGLPAHIAVAHKRVTYCCIDCGKEKAFYPSELVGKCARYKLVNGRIN